MRSSKKIKYNIKTLTGPDTHHSSTYHIIDYLKQKENRNNTVLVDIKGKKIVNPSITVKYDSKKNIFFTVGGEFGKVEKAIILIEDPIFPGKKFSENIFKAKSTFLKKRRLMQHILNKKIENKIKLKSQTFIVKNISKQVGDDVFPGIKLIMEKKHENEF